MTTFTCAACGGVYVALATDEEVAAEAAAAFSPDELVDAASVCDDCWHSMRAAMPDFDARYAGQERSTS